MQCPQAIELLSEYYEEALPDGQRVELQMHLVECPPCKDCLEEVASIILIARTLCDGSEDCPDSKLMFQRLKLVSH